MRLSGRSCAHSAAPPRHASGRCGEGGLRFPRAQGSEKPRAPKELRTPPQRWSGGTPRRRQRLGPYNFSAVARRLSSFGSNVGEAQSRRRRVGGPSRSRPVFVRRSFSPSGSRPVGVLRTSDQAFRRTLRRSDLRAVFTQEPYNGAPETSGFRRRGLEPHSALLVLTFSLPGPPECLANTPSAVTGTFRYPNGCVRRHGVRTVGHACGALLYSRTLRRSHVRTFR